jgi:Peptidase family M28/PA domain
VTRETLLSEIDGQRLRRHVEQIADSFPYRLAGTTAARRMADYSARSLSDAGVQSSVEEIEAFVSFPGAARVILNGAEALEFSAQTCAHSTSTGAEGMTAPIVDIGGGTLEDLRRHDVRGKIVLSDLAKAPARPEKQRLAARAGAAGCVTINWGTPQGTELPFGSVKPVWGNPVPGTSEIDMGALPCVGVSRADGLRLQALMRDGPRTARLHADVDNRWAPIHYTLGHIAGLSSDFIIAGGHQDSWIGPAATDNATGSACLLELARVFASERGGLRRGLKFGFWAGHETGTMASSAHFVDRNWDELRDHAAAYLQIDQPACAGTWRWGSHSTVELRRLQQEVEAAVLGDRPRSWRRSTKIGDSSFFGLGVPMLAGIAGFTADELAANGNAPFGWWHHTTENTLDKVNWDDLIVHARVYAAYLWELCNVPVLPFDFVAVADGLIKRLQELSACGERIGILPLLAQARHLRECAVRLDEVIAAFNRRCAAVSEVDEEKAGRLNATVKRLSRSLLPIESTAVGTYGHDPYGLTAQSTVLPALFDLPAHSALPPGTEMHRRLQTQLLRDRNRISDSLAAAIEAAAAAR